MTLKNLCRAALSILLPLSVLGCAATGNHASVSEQIRTQTTAATEYYKAVSQRGEDEVRKIEAAARAKKESAVDDVSIRVRTSGTGDIAAPAGFQFPAAAVVEVESTVYHSGSREVKIDSAEVQKTQEKAPVAEKIQDTGKPAGVEQNKGKGDGSRPAGEVDDEVQHQGTVNKPVESGSPAATGDSCPVGGSCNPVGNGKVGGSDTLPGLNPQGGSKE